MHRRRYRYADPFNHHHWLRDVSERRWRRALVGRPERWLLLDEGRLPMVVIISVLPLTHFDSTGLTAKAANVLYPVFYGSFALFFMNLYV